MASRVFNPMIELEPFDSESGCLNAIVDRQKEVGISLSTTKSHKLSSWVAHFHSAMSFLLILDIFLQQELTMEIRWMS